MNAGAHGAPGPTTEVGTDDRRRRAARPRRANAPVSLFAPTERDAAHALAPLTGVGYHLLPGRGWPAATDSARTRQQVDLIVVGPSGLFIVDTTSWSDVTVETGRVFRGESDVTNDLAALADLAYATEGRMADIGLAPGEVHALVILAGRSGIKARIATVEMVGETDAARYILARGMRLSTEQIDALLAACLDYFPVVDAAASVDDPLGPDDPDFDTIPLLTTEEIRAQLEANLRAPTIASWMSVLAPEQAHLARQSFDGPSRIRGAVGTGKSVVGLHRAAYLARTQPGVILVTSYVSTLPAVQASLMDRLAPDIRGRIEFVGTHAFARRLLTDRRVALNLQPAIADAEFDTTWRLVGRPGLLGYVDPRAGYWEDEIEHVIKGRMIGSLDEYLAVARIGRRRALDAAQRTAVWHLYEAYQKRMSARGAADSADLILAAELSLRETPLDRYAAVIVDEAQDLSLAMVRMLHHLVGDRANGLTLIGDVRQSVYPGGYTLAEAGVSVTGRSSVLRVNYRNTAEIAAFAAASTGAENDSHDDANIDSEVATDVDTRVNTDVAAHPDAIAPRPEGSDHIARHGAAPLVVRFTNRAAHDAELPRRVRELSADGVTRLGDIGVLALTAFGVRSAIVALQKANIPVVELTNFDGRPIDAVKVGTVKRAKGLEFAHVLVVHVPSSLMVAPGDTPTAQSLAAEEDDGMAEASAIQRRELYVAMSRARRSLWVGTTP